MMNKALRFVAVVAATLPAWAGAQTDFHTAGNTIDCRGSDGERPYVCDIGPAEPLSMASFVQLIQDDAAVRATVARIGLPDAAELQRVLVNDPWLSYEIRTYYRDFDRVYVYGRAFILGNPQISLLRHEGPIPASWLASHRPVDVNAVALRAEEAADRAEALANRADRLADRAEAIAGAMAADFPRRLQKQ